MNNRVFSLPQNIFLIVIIFFLSSCEDPAHEIGTNIRYRIGDNQEWAKRDFNDSSWSVSRGALKGDTVFWARLTVEIKQYHAPFQPQGLAIVTFGAYEAYWDGVLIGKNGHIREENSREGEMARFFILPDSLVKKGKHVLALRISQHYYTEEERDIDAIVANYADLVTFNLTKASFIYILAGGFLITGIYFLILFFNNKKTFSFLLFSISSFLFFLLIIMEYIVYYIPIHYSWHYVRLEIISVLTLLVAFFIPLYLLIQFSFPKKKFFISLYLLILLMIYGFNHKYGSYDDTTGFLSLSMWISAVIIVGYALVNKTKGALVVFFGLAVNVLINYLIANDETYEQTLAISFTILLLCMFYILFIRERERQKAYEHSLIQTTVLKNELLKKKIQPHFLMNTLTSLVDWIEDSPAQGVQFIEALAVEFDLLNQVEDHQLIPIDQEIQLCKSFLNIMRYRKEQEYIWTDEGIDENESVPPAIIHTLLENGITHCLPLDDGTIKFRLIYESMLNYKTYTFLTYANIRNSSKKIEEGTGTKYVKARLTESYKNKWEFVSEPVAHGWKNVITIYRK